MQNNIYKPIYLAQFECIFVVNNGILALRNATVIKWCIGFAEEWRGEEPGAREADRLRGGSHQDRNA